MELSVITIRAKLAILMFALGVCSILAIISLWTTFQRPMQQSASPFVEQKTSAWSFEIHGQPKSLPDLSFMDADGHQTNLAAFGGKLLLLNIWATWCPPCIEELPSMMALSDHFGDQALALVALSVDRDPFERVPEFLERHELTDLPVYYDPNLAVSRALEISNMPTTLIINRAGQEVARTKGPFDWNNQIAHQVINNLSATP